jgi:hypothetical protein
MHNNGGVLTPLVIPSSADSAEAQLTSDQPGSITAQVVGSSPNVAHVSGPEQVRRILHSHQGTRPQCLTRPVSHWAVGPEGQVPLAGPEWRWSGPMTDVQRV